MAKTSPEILLPFIHLDKAAKTPIYKQVYDSIKEAILSGMLKPKDRMPASRILAQGLSIARNGVILAFEQLILEGYLVGKVGAGTFVAELYDMQLPRGKRHPSKSIKEFESNQEKLAIVNKLTHRKFISNDCAFEPIVPFQTSVPSFADFPYFTWAKIAASVYRKMDSLHLGYDDSQGYLPLRESIAKHLRLNRSINCTSSDIVVVNGSRQAIHLIAEILIKKGDQCWMEDPGYGGAKSAMIRFGGRICPIKINESGIDLEYAVANFPKAKLAFVTPSHQYPMGITMPLIQRIKLLGHVSKHNMFVVEDDYDSDFRYNGRPIAALKAIDTEGSVLYVGTFSKSLFPALRIGYIVLPSIEMAKQFAFLKATTDRQNPIVDQAILHEFMRSGNFERHIRKMRILYKRAQDDLALLLTEQLGNKIRLSPADAGMHFVIEFLDKKDADLIRRKANKVGLILMPVDDLAIKFKKPNSFVIGFTGYSIPQLTQGVKLLKSVIES
ncbi:MAG: PLP-dependent aminotransferase family protein [Bacteroidota bacterium]|nr:PLP-dependent aminotransferase family protein [Bacteroidota bacterium]